jgi:hypothetical protein
MGPYIAAVLLGGMVGAIELATRYRDQPIALVKLLSAWVYVAVNAAASGFALLFIHTFNWHFGASASPNGITIIQVLVASFGAMVLFRSSIATVRVGDQDVPIGPSVVLSSLLAIADRAVDRKRGSGRSKDVARIMKGVSFQKAYIALPTYCLALLQNVSPAEQEELSKAVNSLILANISDSLKTLNLGLVLMNISGPTLLEAAVKALDAEIKGTG